MDRKVLERKLRKADQAQAFLYIFCNFIASMLVTAYAAILFSPTVLRMLPEGGDSRKQMVAIFVMALFGCIVFSVYAVGLFFRKKSRQLGILMALGASRRQLAPGLLRETVSMSMASSLAGTAAGLPFVWCIWQLFRLFLTDSEEMALKLDLCCLVVSMLLLLVIMSLACLMALRYLKRVDIMDIIQEEHKNEPVQELGKWCGPTGIVLLLTGAALGYGAPGIYMKLRSAYPPAWLNLLYAPVFLGLYLIMLHTVVHSWGSRKNPYRNLIARSMMKFQGRQTVNNLLTSTVLIAGACFAAFYIPMVGTGRLMDIDKRAYDYAFHYRADQTIPDQRAIQSMAKEYKVHLKDWKTCGYITLGMGNIEEVEEENGAFHNEYVSLAQEGKFLSEEAFCFMTGQSLEVEPGTYYGVSNEEETGIYFLSSAAKELTDMAVGTVLPVRFAGYVHCSMLTDAIGYYVLDKDDYQKMSEGLDDTWKGDLLWFNADGKDSYSFARQLYRTFVSAFGAECEIADAYDRVEKAAAEARGEVYWGDTDAMPELSYAKPDSFEFRNNWTYMPKIRILDRNEFLQTFAVYWMTFLFIAIVCMLAALVIGYTRCQTIALNNRYVFECLKRLGAAPAFLDGEVKKQCRQVFLIPAAIGMCTMYLLYGMIMYANDGKLTWSETTGLLVCLGVLLILALLIFLVCRRTETVIGRMLERV